MRIPRPRSVIHAALSMAATASLLIASTVHASSPGVQIQDQLGRQITKEQLFGAALTGAWQLGKADACGQISQKLGQPGDYSAYNISCDLGGNVDVTSIQPLNDGFLLTANVSRSTVNADFTQPFAGKWADPSAQMSWDSRLSIQVALTQDGSCR